MDLKMNFVNIPTLLFCLLLTLITKNIAQPLTDLDTFISTPIDNDFPDYQPRLEVSKGSLLNHLTRGYYYIDKGEITPVNRKTLSQSIPAGRRRQYTEDDQISNKHTSLERYKKSHAKRKMLFVPNFFG